jgi:hypothetical protein
VDNRQVIASASYAELRNQDFNYAHRAAANNLARKVVELMEKQW